MCPPSQVAISESEGSLLTNRTACSHVDAPTKASATSWGVDVDAPDEPEEPPQPARATPGSATTPRPAPSLDREALAITRTPPARNGVLDSAEKYHVKPRSVRGTATAAKGCGTSRQPSGSSVARP